MTADTVRTEHVSIGIQLPTTDGFGAGCADIGAAARAAETAAFDSVWVGDHFSFHAPVIESIVAATVAVATTRVIKVGFGVLLPAMRHPGWLAKQLSSLQAVSRDRLVLGIGVGGEFPAEWAAVGVPQRERGTRTDAFLDALPSLLGGITTRLGPPWNAVVPPLLPTGAMPEVWVGGRSDAALRRAVRFGAGWLGVWMGERQIRRRIERLRALAEESGAATPPVGCSVLVHIDADEERGHHEMASFMQSIYRLPYERLRPFTVTGDEQAAAGRLRSLIDAGVVNLVLLPTGRDPAERTDQLSRVAARLRAPGTNMTQTHPLGRVALEAL